MSRSMISGSERRIAPVEAGEHGERNAGLRNPLIPTTEINDTLTVRLSSFSFQDI